MEFWNNPFDLLIEVMKEEYPDAKADIYFGQTAVDGKDTFGVTIFPHKENDLQRPAIEIYYDLPLPGSVEILAHELAHVVAGIEEGHGPKWEEIFENIFVKFDAKSKERFSESPLS